MTDVLDSLKQCADNSYHPLLLPLIIFETECMADTEMRQRKNRDWLRNIERLVRKEFERQTDDSYRQAELHAELLRRDIVQCHAQLSWKAPKDYIRILQSFRACLEGMDPEVQRPISNTKEVAETHRKFGSRIHFLEQRFESLSVYVDQTLMRLSIQQNAVSPTLSLRRASHS